MNYFSIGNNCASASVLSELGIRTEAGPFDWVPGTSGIVLHCFQTDMVYFTQMGQPHYLYGINDHYLIHQNPLMKDVPISHRNYYGSHFSHYTKENTDDIIKKFERRCKRLLDVVKSDKPLTLLYTNEYELYFKQFRDNVDRDYIYLQELEKLLVNKYKKNNFVIICVNVNKDRENTDHIVNIRVDWDTNFMFDDGCSDMSLFWNYKTKIKNILSNNGILRGLYFE